jgi:hypothetical protein
LGEFPVTGSEVHKEAGRNAGLIQDGLGIVLNVRPQVPWQEGQEESKR